jgi:hypothetical protein
MMQDVDSKENTELGSEDLTLSWRELSVGSVGHCQSAGNWIAVAYNPQALLGLARAFLIQIPFCRKSILSTR